jgi:hypothetical protein
VAPSGGLHILHTQIDTVIRSEARITTGGI